LENKIDWIRNEEFDIWSNETRIYY
jgi:hypothetical protein